MPDRTEPTISFHSQGLHADEPIGGIAPAPQEDATGPGKPVQPARPRGPASGWLIGVTVAVYLAIIALRALSGPQDGIPYRLGAATVAAPLSAAWVILLFSIWKRFRNSRSRYRIALGVGIWLLVGAVAQFVVHRGEEDAAQRRIVAEDLRKSLAYAETRIAALQAGQSVPAYVPVSNAMGRWGDIESALNVALKGATGVREQYVRELATLGFFKVFAPGWSVAGPDLAESRRIVKQAQAIAGRYALLSGSLIDDLPAQVQVLSFNTWKNKDKAAFIGGIRRSQPESHARMAEMWKCESGILVEITAMLDLLDQARGRWRERDGKILFARSADQVAYEAHRHAIVDLDKQETALRESAIMPFLNALGA